MCVSVFLPCPFFFFFSFVVSPLLAAEGIDRTVLGTATHFMCTDAYAGEHQCCRSGWHQRGGGGGTKGKI